MKGEITIAEKEPGQRGTCFRFHVLLTVCEHEPPNADEEDSRRDNDWPQTGFHQHFASFWSPAAKTEGSHIILFIAGEERKRVLKRYIENYLNIKVTIIKQEKILHQELRKLKQKMDPCGTSYAEKSESSLVDYLTMSASSNSDTGPLDVTALGIKDENDNVCRKTNSKSLSSFTLVLIDASAGSASELIKILANFKRDKPNLLCKVVWLDNPIVCNGDSKEHGEYRLVPLCDHVINKPFHGSRLIEVLKLLPECKGASQRNFPKLMIGTSASQELQHWLDPNTSNKLRCLEPEAGASSSHFTTSLQQSDAKSSEKELNGKKFLVVDDNPILNKLTTAHLRKLGANFEVCSNGKEAFDRICKILRDQRKDGHSKADLPYDYIMMDCEVILVCLLKAFLFLFGGNNVWAPEFLHLKKKR